MNAVDSTAVTVHHEFCRAPLHPGPCKGWKAAKAAGRDHSITHADLIPGKRPRKARAPERPSTPDEPQSVIEARRRQADIDHARSRATVLAEVEEWLNNQGTTQSLIRRVEQDAARLGIPGNDRDMARLQAAIATGSHPKIMNEVERIAKKLGLTRIERAGQIVRYDRTKHRETGKETRGRREGDLMYVDRPGYRFNRQGKDIRLEKADVSEASPQEIAAAQTAAVVHHEFCRAPLHPGPCKGWKNTVKATADVVTPTPAAAPKRARRSRTKPQLPARVSEKEFLARHGGEKESRQLSTGDNASMVHLVTMNDGSKAVVKKSKSDIETGKLEYDAEELGAQVAEALGLRPPKVYRTGDDEAYFDYVSTGRLAATVPEIYEGWGSNNMATGPYEESVDGRRIGLLDVLIENPDRHVGNWFVQDDGSITPIDHGLAWSTAAPEVVHLFPPERPFDIGGFAEHYLSRAAFTGEWPDNDLSPAYAARLRDKLAGLKPAFDDAGRTDLFERMMIRMGIIADHAKGTVTL